MASPSEDITAFAKRLRNGVTSAGDDPQAQGATPQAQAAGGSAIGVLRNTVPGPTAPTAPAAPTTAPPVGMARLIAAGKSAGKSVAGIPGAVANGAGSLLRSPMALGAGGTALAAAPEALRVGKVLDNKNASWNDVGTQASEGAGRLATAGLGAATGAVAGAPFGPIGSAVGALGGGAYGYWAGDKAIKGLRSMAGLDTRSPDQQLGVAPGSPPAAPVAAPAAAVPGAPNPTDQRLATGVQMPPTGAAVTAATAPVPKNEILRNGNEFSGKNIKEGFSYVNPDGSTLGSNAPPGNGMGIGVDGYMKQLANLRSLPEPERGGMGGIGATDTLRQSPIDPNWMAKHQMANSGSPLDRRQAMLLASQEGIANKSNSQAMALAQLREGGENSRAQLSNTTARRGQDIQQGLGSEGHAITREGNQLTYAGHMAPLQLAAMQRGLHSQVYQGVGAGNGAPTADHHLAAAAQFDAMGLSEQADKARAAATQMQTLRGVQEAQSKAGAAGAAEVFKPMFTRKVTDAQGNVKEEFDEVGASKAAATMRSLHGAKFDELPDEKKRSAYTDVVTQQKNMEAERQVMPGFVDRMKDVVGMYQPPPAATAARDLRGGEMTNAGLLSPPGVDRRSTLVKLPNGETINYGIADDAQIAAIKKRTLR